MMKFILGGLGNWYNDYTLTEEAIREATGACPEWDTQEPCLSDWCLVLRTALLEKQEQSDE